MWGLILKDLYTVRKSLAYTAVIVAVFGVVYSGSSAAFGVVGAMASMMVISVSSTTISYDAFYHWDRYAAALPISRGRVVAAKYLLILLMAAAAMLLCLAMGGLLGWLLAGEVQWAELLASAGASLAVGLLGAAVVVPLYYRFGVQQCRFALVAVYGIPALAVVLWVRVTGFAPTEAQLEALLQGLALAAPVICLAALGISWGISTRVYQKKGLK